MTVTSDRYTRAPKKPGHPAPASCLPDAGAGAGSRSAAQRVALTCALGPPGGCGMTAPQNALGTDALRVTTGVPGAVISAEEVDGVLIERNGAGSVVAHVYPNGLDFGFDDESLQDRVDRLAAELKEAKGQLRKAVR